MKTPINDAINSRKEHISFHTPAHSGVIDSFTKDLIKYDITELSYSDNLLYPRSVIEESQKLVSAVYGAENTFFITNGATAGVHTAVKAFRDKVFLIGGNAHSSVFSALRTVCAKAFYTGKTNGYEDLIKKTGAKVLLITSPDYFGNTLDMEEISEAAKKHDCVLIIDASHGGHFAFCDKLPVSASVYGDIVIHSLHKTLPVLTGGALLHCKDKYVDIVFSCFRDTHSTSPSYAVIASIERAVALYSQEGNRLYSEALKEISCFKDGLALPFTVDKNDDPTRLVISSPYDAVSVCRELEKDGIFPEMYYRDKIVFIVTPNNFKHLRALASALNRIKDTANYISAKEPANPELAELKFFSNFEYVEIDKAAGRTAYREIGFYPPGVPFILPGAVIGEKDVDYIKRNINGIFGLDKGRVAVVIY